MAKPAFLGYDMVQYNVEKRSRMRNWGAVALAVAVVCTGFSASAENEVRDPQHLLEKLEIYLGNTDFSAAFKSGDRAVFQQLVKNCRYGCGPDGCSALCESI